MRLLPIITEPACRDHDHDQDLPASATPASGPRFWRSLDELAQTPEFEARLQQEFPSKLPRMGEGFDRRRFLTLMGASFALAGVTGCTRNPTEEIVPFVKAPENIVPGEPLYYATALTRGGYALGVLVESHVGRPTKIEGNPQHPASRGATDAITQAEVLSLYDPDRSQTVMFRSVIDTWDRFLSVAEREVEGLKTRNGKGLRILTETVTSPTLTAQLEALLKELPDAKWHQYEPAGLDNVREGTMRAFGSAVEPVYHFDKAQIVVSLDADFLSVFPGSVRYAREFIDGRRHPDGKSPMNRLYVAESTPTITGAMADHRLALRPSLVESVARGIAAAVKVAGVKAPGEIPGASGKWLTSLVADLEANRGTSLVVAGPGQPPAVHALAHAINAALDNAGETVTYHEPIVSRPLNQQTSLKELATDMAAGKVETLLILGGNPVHDAPASIEFAKGLSKVRLRIHLSQHHDETSFLCDWHVPQAHALETWSDARAFDGTASIVQPLIAPLYGGRSAHELVAVFSGQAGRTSYELVQDYWKTQLSGEASDAAAFDKAWRKAIHDGVIVGTEKQPAASASLQTTIDFGSSASPTLKAGEFEIEFRPDPTVWDGRYANNGWLQELPKPITKLTWDNAAAVSPEAAKTLGVSNGDVLEIKVDGRSVQAPVWITPGQPVDCISLTMGYGRTRAGKIGTGIGYNVQTIRPASAAWFTVGSISLTGTTHRLATTQDHHSMEGRDIVRVKTNAQLAHPESHGEHSHEHELVSLYPEEDTTQGNQWAMVINQTACIGCNACMVACQAENNVAVVGKDQVLVGREMHWLRIDRYFAGELEDPETYFQPMLCVHCEKAPCEVVCPVGATIHDHEGTSNMVYNRCVGTRYCSNNCPYKVRRFNFLQYSDETTPSLKLMRNPDVTVRSRGVMEKCSYCIQRLDLARIAAKKEGRLVEDGEVQTACQQVCPTSAIGFGNLNAPAGSKVKELKASPLNYSVLGELNTQPRTTYLARVANPHPDLPGPTVATPAHAADQATTGHPAAASEHEAKDQAAEPHVNPDTKYK